MTSQGIFLVPSRISAPGLKDACFVKTHILPNHKLGLHAHEQGHQDEKERQHELKPHQYVAKGLSLHAGSIRAFQDQSRRLGSGIQGRGKAGDDGRYQRHAEHQHQNADVILQRQTVRHIRCPGSPGHDVHDQAGNRKCDERDKAGVQQLSSNQGAASFAQNLPGVDALDAS